MKFSFFLGGYDAEMCEIKNLLHRHQQKSYDKHLSWGARLSSYKMELTDIKEEEVPVLVELIIDIPLSDRAIIIDHHRKKAGKNKPSSIEQVAELLNIKLNRWQKLIAVNDVGWIGGLIEFGATKKEIEAIRKYDRKCQGVKQEHEKAAEIAIHNLRSYNSLAVLELPHNHASTVMDRIYNKYKNILVYTPEQTNFSGRGYIVKMLAKKYPESWYGGNLPDKGFWGIENKIINIKNIVLTWLKEV